jgi:hypothetical protein
MIPRVFSDRPDFLPHFVPLWDPGGFHGCALPPVLSGAGNPSSASDPLASDTRRSAGCGFATATRRSPSRGRSSSSASADRSFTWRRSSMLADRGRRRTRGMSASTCPSIRQPGVTELHDCSRRSATTWLGRGANRTGSGPVPEPG